MIKPRSGPDHAIMPNYSPESPPKRETTLNPDVAICPACSRKTAAARAACIYCGTALGIQRIEVAPAPRHIDSFENAFNTVLVPTSAGDIARAEAALATALSMDIEEARAFVGSAKRLPVCRSLTRPEAELIASLVRTCGLQAAVVEDAELELQRETSRARRVALEGEHVLVAYGSAARALNAAEIVLMVVGVIRRNRTDFTEGIVNVTGQGSSLQDLFEFRSDQMILDVYGPTLDESFRIRADAFDYSGLVNPMSFRAEINFQTSCKVLAAAAPGADIDLDFSRVRHLLGRAWPERSRTESRGIKRAGLAHQPVAQSSIISDNGDQFDRYSRLMYHAIRARRDRDRSLPVNPPVGGFSAL